MTAKRSIADRLLQLIDPTPVRSFAPPPQKLADGLWSVDRQLALPPGLRMATRMTVIGLPNGQLLLHSPVALDAALRTELAALGEVAAFVAPNSFHYVFAPEYAAAYPAARLWVAPGLGERVPAFAGASVLGADSPPLCPGVLQHAVFGPVGGVAELAFLHQPSRTLLLTDLAFNIPHIDGAYQRLAWRLAGVPQHFGPSRTARLTLLRDRTIVRRFIERLLDWDFTRIIVAHGDVIEHDARGELERAFAAYL